MTQPPTTTATSCLSSRRGATNNETKATPTQSPTACHNPLLSERSPTGSRLSRKHVQFPDTSASSQTQRPGNRAFGIFPSRRRNWKQTYKSGLLEKGKEMSRDVPVRFAVVKRCARNSNVTHEIRVNRFILNRTVKNSVYEKIEIDDILTVSPIILHVILY